MAATWSLRRDPLPLEQAVNIEEVARFLPKNSVGWLQVCNVANLQRRSPAALRPFLKKGNVPMIYFNMRRK